MMRVGIAGAGGIGSNVAVNLVRAGWTTLRLIDFDRVDLSNLNRQFYFGDQAGADKIDMLRVNLLRIAPQADIEIVPARLAAENISTHLSDCPVVVEALDDAAMKKVLLENLAESGQMVVAASGIAGRGLGNIGSRRLGNCFIFGDFASDCDDYELYCPKISIISAMMADQVLRILGQLAEKGGKR
jgi:sulfur carrier protein ThiS adenylyltransferase